MLIEVHMLQNHAPSNLNRDESGSPKSAIFGGYRRARISSQCLKRCYRTSRTFRDEVDGLGMHTRAMPAEIKTRLLAHANNLAECGQEELQTKFKDWAMKCQEKLADILGREGKETKTNDRGDEGQSGESLRQADAEDENEDHPKGIEGVRFGKTDKNLTAQSIFWRAMEIQALFDAYRERIEWDCYVPENMKTKIKASDMLKAAKQTDSSNVFGARVKEIMAVEAPKLEKLNAKAKSKEEEKIAKKLENLILDRFDPKEILRQAGLRPDGIPVDMALFGRMVASPLMHNVEASCQFAHAISTHEFTREFDFWTRMDDRRDKRLDFFDAFNRAEKLEPGSDGMGDAEFTSACYYSYFNVDFTALTDNLTGKSLAKDLDDSDEREKATRRACNAVVGLIKAAIFERPTGKFNSMATPSLPSLVLVEARDSHVPVSYADAFAKPIDPKNEEILSDTGHVQRMDLPRESANRLIQEANRITKAFNRTARDRLIFTGGADIESVLEGLNTKLCSNRISDGIDNSNPCENIPFTPVEDVKELLDKLQMILGFLQEKKNV